MLSRRSYLSLVAFVFAFAVAASSALAQSGVRPKPSPTPEEAPDEEKIFTEEVRVPVFAFDEQGRFDPRLEVDDVLVNEDGVPQQVKSVRRLPASVLILLGAGGEVSPFMRTNTTRAIAMNVLKTLREGDQIAALSFSGKTEVLHGWTEDKVQVAREIDAQYVVTYQPKRPLRTAPATEYRRIHVGARRVGLALRARRGYVVGTMR